MYLNNNIPARDIYHFNAKNALIKDGWIITHDPLTLRWGTTDLFVDLGAEQLLAAEKQERKIAVEVKSFIGTSVTNDLTFCIRMSYFAQSQIGIFILQFMRKPFSKHSTIRLAGYCLKTSVFRLLSLIQTRR